VQEKNEGKGSAAGHRTLVPERGEGHGRSAENLETHAGVDHEEGKEGRRRRLSFASGRRKKKKEKKSDQLP